MAFWAVARTAPHRENTGLLDDRGAWRRYSAPIMLPLRLSDSQLDAVMAAAAPLAPDARGQFLEAVAQALQRREIGDGAVHRAVAEAQKRFFDPPQLEKAAGKSKWSR